VAIGAVFHDPHKMVLNSKTFNPMAIVASAFNPGIALEEEVKNWLYMSVKMKPEV